MITLVKLFKSELYKDVVYNFINSRIEESEYCIDMMRKYFHKKLVMTTKFLNCDNFLLLMMLKQEIIVISLETIKALHLEIIISTLN